MAEPSDLITLRGLSAVGNHGVYDFERSGAQVFTADLTLHVDSRQAAMTDDVKHTVDYAQIADAAVAILTGKPVYLLETLAHHLAEMALSNPQVAWVEVTVHKPMAPVRHQFSDVSVTITRSRDAAASRVGKHSPEARSDSSPTGPSVSRVVLALGSNLGDSAATLSQAVGALMEVRGLEIDDVSPLVRTRPVLAPGQATQPDYHNAIVLARTILEPTELLATLQSIEAQFGRTREERWGARTLDIDIVDFGGRVESLPGLDLPHPRAHSRAFVLFPWSLIAPEDTLPTGRRVADLAERAPDRAGIVDARADWLEEPPPEARAEGAPAVLRMPPPPDSPHSAKQDGGSGSTPDGPVVSEPRAARSATVIRGNRVTLAPVDRDFLFQRLLKSEEAREVVGAPQGIRRADSSRVAQPVPPAAVRSAEVPRVEAHRDIPQAAPTEAAAERPRSRRPVTPPPEPPRAHEPVAFQPEGLQLPDWRPVREGHSVRIVDAMEVGETAGEAAWPQTPSRGVSRRRVVRPTPTGMIPLQPPDRYEDHR